MMNKGADRPAYAIPVYKAEDFSVVNGANLGDPVSFASELDLDDTYDLKPGAELHLLSLVAEDGQAMTVSSDTAIGTAGARVFLDSCLTVMTFSGKTTEVLVLVEVDGDGNVAAIYALPMAELQPRTGYTLVGIDTENASQRFAELACVSFTRGTRITMASGEQKEIEKLAVGDMVLTRDDGVQQVRWIGQSTARAVGDFAPIRIRAGALNNANDLLVSPDHRLFIYQRSDALGAGRSEILVRARHLVNGDTVVQDAGGFVDYFQVLFDRHQIIYAEGIAAETLLIDTRTRRALPKDLNEKLGQALPGHADRAHLNFEVDEHQLKTDMAALLKRASTR